MVRKCKCCSREIIGSKCNYCKYINVEVLDNSGSEIEQERISQYKKQLIEKITDFSINAFTYKWDSSLSKLDAGRIEIKLADGINCFDKIAWSQKSFGQNDDNQSERLVVISYKFEEKKKDLYVRLKMIKCDDFWKLGVKINHDMTANFYLGTTDNYTVAGPYALEFE